MILLKRTVLFMSLVLVLGGCSTSGGGHGSDSGGASSVVPDWDATLMPIHVDRAVPFSASASIKPIIKTDCQIDTKLAEYIQQYSEEKGIPIVLVDHVSNTDEGRVLVMEITNAISEGNPFIGHHKSTTVKGELWENGEKIGSFVGKRNSRGGFGAGFKSSCSVLGRTVRSLGEDISDWLEQPLMAVHLGDW